MHFLIRLIINAVALLIVAYLFSTVFGSQAVSVTSPVGALVAAFVLGIVNAILRPILIILTLPIQIVTLGLFTFIINGFLFWWVGQWGLGLVVVGFWPAFWGAIVLGIVSYLLSMLFRGVDKAAA